MLAIVSGAVPLLLSVTDCVGLVVPTRCEPNARLAGANAAAGAGCLPIPVRASICGVPAASSSIATLALRAPPALGVKVTEIVHLEPAGSVAGAIGQSSA